MQKLIGDALVSLGYELKRCSVRDLSVLAYANGFTMWHYKADSLDDFSIQNFFFDVHDMVAKGDMIIGSANDGTKTFYIVSADTKSVVVAQV